MYFFNFFLILIFLNFKNCGSELVQSRSERVQGGTNAKLEDWSFMVAVVYGKYVAALGTLIREDWVLTMGSAVDGPRKEKFTLWFGEMRVRLGTADIKYVDPKDIELESGFPGGFKEETPIGVITENDKVIDVEKTIFHDDYIAIANHDRARHAYYNFALLKLSRSDSLAKPIEFARKPFDKTCRTEMKDVCHAAGWGLQAKVALQATINLQEIGQLKVCSYLKETVCLCDADIGAIFLQHMIKDNVGVDNLEVYQKDKLLALTEGNKYVVEKDAGGPLICENLTTGEKILQGIIITHYQSDIGKHKGKQLNIFGDVGLFNNIDKHLGEGIKATTTTTTTKRYTNDGHTKEQVTISRSSISRKNKFTLTIFLICIKILLN